MPAFRGPDGRVVYVPEAEADRYRTGGEYQEVGDVAAGAAQNRIAPTDNGVLGSVGATVSSALSGATLGASDWLLKGVLTKGQFEQLAQDRADNPWLSGAGQTVGMIAPALVSGGAVTPAGALGRVAAEGIEASRAVGGAAGVAGQLAVAGGEGALQNAGIYLSDVALGDRDLTAEGINGALGTGLLFGAAGIPVGYGIEAGTIAARRMFARYAQGGAQAASDAAAAWTEQAQRHLEGFDQAADLAKAKLAEAQAAREAAGLQRLRASAEMADARAFTPPQEFPGAPGTAGAAGPEASVGGAAQPGAVAPGAPPAVPVEPPEVAMARALRDRAKALGGAPITPDELAAVQPGLGTPEFQREYNIPGARPPAGNALDALAAETGIPAAGPATSVREHGLRAVPVTADEAGLSAALAEYQDARRAFAELHAQVDPDLDALLRGIDPVELQRPAVPIGEFGAPGARGIKGQETLARIAAGTGREEGMQAAELADVTGAGGPRALRAQGTPAPARSLGEVAAEQAPVPIEQPATAVGKRPAAAVRTGQSLLDSPIASSKPLSEGDNGARLVKLESGDEAVVKRAADEKAIDESVPAGTFYKREKAAYDVSKLLGIDNVPETVIRDVDGSPASVQRFVRAPEASGPLERAESEKMRVFDFITGNADRPDNYLKITKGGRTAPVLIDNGFSFPVGRVNGFVQVAKDIPDAVGLLPGTTKIIKDLDLEELARTLHANGIEPDAIRETLYRARYLQKNPTALALDGRVKANTAWSTDAWEAGQRIGHDEASRLDAVVDRLGGGRGAGADGGAAAGAPVRGRIEVHEIGRTEEMRATMPDGSTRDLDKGSAGTARNRDGTAVIKRPAAVEAPPPPTTGPARELKNEAEFRAMQSELRGKLTDEESKQALRYSREYYLDVNRHLRGNPKYANLAESEAKIIPALDSAIDKSITSEPLVTYRTVMWDPGEAGYGLKPGDEFVDPGYMSTSWRPDTKGKYGNVNFVITSPAGSRVAAIPSSADEGELLLPRGTRLRITERQETPGILGNRDRITLHATVEPAAAAPAAAGDDLLAALQGTGAKVNEGQSIGRIGAESPARAEYVANRAAKQKADAEHFRGKALEAREARAQAVAQGETPNPFHEPEPARMSGADLDQFFADLRAPKTRDAYVAQNIGRAMREEGSHAAALAKVEREWAERGGHPLDIKRLEMAHDAALERAATAAEPAERAAAAQEAQAIEKQMTQVGARPGAVEDVAALAPAVTRVEKAAAALTEALGDAAPAAAKEHAAAFRAAEDNASRKTTARIGQAADDAAGARAAAANRDPLAPPPRAAGDDLVLGPSQKQQRIAAAQKAQREAGAAYAKARVAEAEAKIGAKQAAGAAAEARAKLGPPPEVPGAAPGGHGIGARAVHAAHMVGYAAELGSDLGIPGIPRPHDIPVIGPLLSAYLKYRALRAAAGRFVGRIPVTGETRAAELAARTRDGVARAVDRSLGLIERNPSTVREALTVGTLKASDALGKRLIDDGGPDAKKGASISEQAAVRMREIAAAATNPALITAAVRAQGRALTDPDLIDALSTHLVNMFQYLNSVAPKGPPPNPFTGKQWTPSQAEAMRFGQQLAIAKDPQVAFQMLAAGTLTPAGADTLRNCYRLLFREGQQRVIQRAAELKAPVAYPELIRLGRLFDVPLHPSLEPENAAALAAAHTPAAKPAPTAQPGSPPTASIANPTNLSSLYDAGGARRAGRI